MGVGPVSLGYCYDVVDAAIREQLEDGITFSLMHPLEVEVAELLREVLPHAEMVRFSKTGADVTSAAVRLARAYTNRDKVLCCGYHGWHDWYISATARNDGIPQPIRHLTHTLDYNDLQSVIDSIDNDTVLLNGFGLDEVNRDSQSPVVLMAAVFCGSALLWLLLTRWLAHVKIVGVTRKITGVVFISLGVAVLVATLSKLGA